MIPSILSLTRNDPLMFSLYDGGKGLNRVDYK